jgi:hypothetical protein
MAPWEIKVLRIILGKIKGFRFQIYFLIGASLRVMECLLKTCNKDLKQRVLSGVVNSTMNCTDA